MQTSKKLTLAIETAIDGGSLSLLKGQIELDFRIGKNGISKAEDILENICGLFEANKVTGENIDLIIISSDVGSVTGLKIGMATARGLTKAFSSRLAAASLIDSLVKIISKDNADKYVIVLPVGKNNIFYRRFTLGNQPGASAIVKTEEFFGKNLNLDGIIYAHQKIIDSKTQFDDNAADTREFISLGENMAKFTATHSRLIMKR